MLSFPLGTWLGVKLRCFPRKRKRKNMPWKLVEFIWRRKHHGDIFGGMLTTLREVALGRERGDAEWTQYVPYSQRPDTSTGSGNEEESSFEEQLGDDLEEDIEVIEVDEVPYEVFPFRRRAYNLNNNRNVRARVNHE